MSDLEPIGSKEISDRGVRGIGSTIAGVGLLVVQAVAGGFGGIVGLVVGGISFIVGASSMKSASTTDRRGGAIAMIAGAVLALPGLAKLLGFIPIAGGLLKAVAGISGFAIGAGAVGLIGYGVYNLIKFRKGLKSRT